MIPHDLLHRIPPVGSSPLAPAVELQQALRSWQSRCEEGAAALARYDLDAVDAALAAREQLRPRIARVIRRIQGDREIDPETLASLGRLQQSAADAENRLTGLLSAERERLKGEMDGLVRPTTPVAYTAAAAPRHRLDIVR